MKKLIALVLAAVTVLLCTACDKWENPELLEGQIPVVLPEQDESEPVVANPLTGEPLADPTTVDNRPVAVMLNNIEAGDVLGFTATVLFLLAPLLLFIYFESEIIEGLGEYRLK